MPTRPTSGPDGFLLDLEQRVSSTEREGLWTLPWGVVGTATRTTSESFASTYRASLSATFVAVPGRWYDLRVRGRVAYGGGGEAVGWLMVDDANVGRWVEYVANAQGHFGIETGFLWTPTSTTTRTSTVVAALEGFGMTVAFQAATTNPGQLSIRDVGPAI